MKNKYIGFINTIRNIQDNNAYILALVLAFIVTAEYFALGKYSYVEMFDIGDYFIPKNLIMVENLLQNGPAYWYPYKIGGLDLLGSGFFYTHLNLNTLLFLLLPGWLASGTYVFMVYYL